MIRNPSCGARNLTDAISCGQISTAALRFARFFRFAALATSPAPFGALLQISLFTKKTSDSAICVIACLGAEGGI